MAWRDPAVKEHIVFSGYHIGGITPTGNAHFISMDVGSLPPFPYTYISYSSFFNGGHLQSIPFDFIVKPFNRGGGFYNQIYYHPKSLISLPDVGSRFTNPQEIFGDFGLNLFKTYSNGGLDVSGCFVKETTQTETWPVQQFFNFNSLPYSFQVVGPSAQVFSATLDDEFLCGGPEIGARPFMGANEANGKFGFKVYPNPATDYLTVSGLSKIDQAKIVLYDMQGRVVLSELRHAQLEVSVNLDVSALENGIYFVQVSSGGTSIFVERVILR